MSALRYRLRVVRYWVTDHAAPAVLVVLGVALALLVTLFASGLLLSPTALGAPASPTTTTTQGPVASPVDPSPAATLVTGLLAYLEHVPGYSSQAATPATIDPLLAGCAASSPFTPQLARSVTLSSSSLVVVADLEVYGAGLGASVLDGTLHALSGCSGDYVQATPTGLDGFVASSPNVAGSSILEVTFRYGDVVVSLYAFPTGYQSASASTLALASLVESRVAAASASCVDPNASTLAARRNPTQRDYHPYTVTTVVTPPAGLARPDQSLLLAPLPVVAAPAPGSVTVTPSAPIAPSVALQITLHTNAPDPVGPGCGWAFTAMAAPTGPAVSDPAPAAIAELESAWAAWPARVATYLVAKATYLADLASYAATPPSTTLAPTTTTTTRPTTTTTLPTASTTAPPTTTTTLPTTTTTLPTATAPAAPR